jgi:hypothetical protein
LQVKPQVPPLQAGVAFATDGQEWPQLPQLFVSLLVLVHVPRHSAGRLGGQPETHEYEPPDPAQTGVPLSAAHAAPQAPQLVDVVNWMQAPPHGEYPALQPNVHELLTQTPLAFETLVVHT